MDMLDMTPGTEKSEIEKLKEMPSPYEKISYFFNLLKQEVETYENFLSMEQIKSFKAYYGFVNRDKFYFMHLKDRYCSYVQHLVNSIDLNTRVLDAGCGYGSESILCGFLGANVSGVDLREERLDVARERLKCYESKLNKRINVKFYAQSVFDISDTFDVIWSIESISHIDPADKFIEFAYRHLGKGGKLIVADSNALNPLAYILSKRDQLTAGGAHLTRKNPKTGEIVPYAQERLLTIPSIKKMVKGAGFRIEHIYSGGFSPSIPFLSYQSRNISYYINKIFDKIPIIRILSGGYTLIAIKE